MSFQEKDNFNSEILVVDDSLKEKPRCNEELYRFLARVHRLVSKVRVFASMARQVSAIQRHVQYKLSSNQGGFILDVRVSFNFEHDINC